MNHQVGEGDQSLQLLEESPILRCLPNSNEESLFSLRIQSPKEILHSRLKVDMSSPPLGHQSPPLELLVCVLNQLLKS